MDPYDHFRNACDDFMDYTVHIAEDPTFFTELENRFMLRQIFERVYDAAVSYSDEYTTVLLTQPQKQEDYDNESGTQNEHETTDERTVDDDRNLDQ